MFFPFFNSPCAFVFPSPVNFSLWYIFMTLATSVIIQYYLSTCFQVLNTVMYILFIQLYMGKQSRRINTWLYNLLQLPTQLITFAGSLKIFCSISCVWLFIYMYVCVPYLSLVPTSARKVCQIPCNWNYRQLWTAMWRLEMEHRSSGKAASSLNCRDISPASLIMILVFV